ncbi:MAG: hypothetical protein GF311_23740 [Candidatus Lokiarchaeota archaeon]|nr:hypothetical protein [Candidatus Lokiarchaeota archaeon]
MHYYKQILKQVCEAINSLHKTGITRVTTKKVRRELKIKSTNRSKITFIWRSLKILNTHGIIEKNGVDKPLTYIATSKIDIEKILDSIDVRYV